VAVMRTAARDPNRGNAIARWRRRGQDRRHKSTRRCSQHRRRKRSRRPRIYRTRSLRTGPGERIHAKAIMPVLRTGRSRSWPSTRPWTPTHVIPSSPVRSRDGSTS
jgi:hypothetical protein